MIKVVIVGVGNCSSSLVQGIHYYTTNPNAGGLVRHSINEYRIADVQVVGAIDVDGRKVGKDISEAIFTIPNCAKKFSEVPHYDVPVVKGHVLDGVAGHMKDSFVVENSQPEENIAEYLKRVHADFLVCYLPVGSYQAAEFYAEEALKAGVGFINAIPVFICSTPEWSDRFKKAGIPCAGDDIKSQFGATYLHRILVENLLLRGFSIDNMYQLNVGGNTDFLNMTDEGRLTSKRISKTNAVTSLFNAQKPKVRIGPSDYIPHLQDSKICYINVNGKQFGDVNYELELKLKVEDSPNSAGVMLDVIRMMKVAKDKGISGNITEVSAFGFKTPMNQFPETEIPGRIDAFLSR